MPGLGPLNAGGNAGITSVSCWRAGYCAAGGSYTDAAGHQQAFVVTQAKGRWQAAVEVPGSGKLNVGGLARVGTLSCSSAGNCGAGGYWWGVPCAPGTAICPRGFAENEVNGRWERLARLEGGGPVSSIVCWRRGDCLAVRSTAFNGNNNPPDYIPFAETETNGAGARPSP